MLTILLNLILNMIHPFFSIESEYEIYERENKRTEQEEDGEKEKKKKKEKAYWCEMGGERWRNAYQEVANSKPLFLTIYATVVVGIVFSSVYVFSAVYSAKYSSSSFSSLATSWLSSPPASSLSSMSCNPSSLL